MKLDRSTKLKKLKVKDLERKKGYLNYWIKKKLNLKGVNCNVFFKFIFQNLTIFNL